MKKKAAIAVAAFVLPTITTGAHAFEFGAAAALQKPGVALGAAAAAPPPGLYGFDQFFTYQGRLVGPGTPRDADGSASGTISSAAAHGFVYVPGWTFLGASYDAVAVVPFATLSVGPPVNFNSSGMHNSYFANELSWKLGDSGFFIKAGLGLYAPTGTQQGANGLANVGNPWWTFQPEFVVSYLKDGWNLTANVFDEINTANSITDYRSGDVLHAEFTATKTIGNWTIGPVAYYVGQITGDRSSAFYHDTIFVNRYDVWAAGGLLGYNFGPVQVSLWGTQELSATASGGTAGPPGIDTAAVAKGFSVFAQLNYRIWAPEEASPPKLSLFHK
ncbi:SphA family protein [Bradyrhizobium macuxiense]|nr:transporter [Bradyrhizobium macuxiense]